MYVEIFCFIAKNWKGLLTHLQNAPLLKYVSSSSNTDQASVSNVSFYGRIYLFSKESRISWKTKWYEDLGSAAKYYFIPESTWKEIINLDPHEG